MTTDTEFIQSVQQLNGLVLDMFWDINERSKKKQGKSIIEQMDEKEMEALGASIAQGTRSCCILMHNYAKDVLTGVDNFKIEQTIEVCDDMLESCISMLGSCAKKYNVSHCDDDDEDDDCDDGFDMSDDAQNLRLESLREIPKDRLRAVLKEAGLTKKELDWAIEKIHSKNQEMDDDDMDIGLSILRKMQGRD